MRTDQHEHKHSPSMKPRVHRHALTEVDAALAEMEARVAALEETMANVILTISQLPGPVTPPVDPIVPVTPPVDPPVVPVVIPGAVCYIAPTGNDTTGNGTQTYPWKTIRKWIDSAPQAGATLYCRGGSYTAAPIARAGWVNDTQYPNLVGTSSSPITIANYPGETPIFTSASTNSFIVIGSGCSYVVFDGLQIASSGGAFSFGGWGPGYTAYAVTNMTLRNMKITQGTGEVYGHNHLVYFSGGCDYVTVEDSVFLGATTGVAALWHTALHAYGGDGGYHLPPAKNILFQRNVFKGWTDNLNPPVVIWDDGNHVANGSLLHNSYIGNTADNRLGPHGALLFQDNATTRADDAYWIFNDVTDPQNTTETNNFFSQTFDASYYLLPGNTGIDAASDGSDAGALDT